MKKKKKVKRKGKRKIYLSCMLSFSVCIFQWNMLKIHFVSLSAYLSSKIIASKNIWYETKGLWYGLQLEWKRKAYFESDLTNNLSSYIYIPYLINLFFQNVP